MASLLVRVDRAVLDAIRARASAEQAQLQPGELPHPELAYLDPQSVAFVVWLDDNTLRCAMTVHEPVLERSALVGGDVVLHDHDLTPLLARLGCQVDVGTWSATPRLLPPNDVDLLRYELGLPMEARRNLVAEAVVVAPEDEIDRQLLADVWADPASDTPRMIYADRLQQRADPRGELIALQLARGDGRITERERELLSRWGPTCLRPLAKFLAGYELRRGFLAKAMVDERQPIPRSLLEHPMWSLVEELQTGHQTLLRLAPLPSLRQLRLEGSTLAFLSSYIRVFERVERILGFELPPQRTYRGISLQDLSAWQRVGTSKSWPALRVLSVDTDHRNGAMLPAIILRTPLGRQLSHLDLTVNPDSLGTLDPHVLFRELAVSPALQRLSLLASFETSAALTLAFERTRGGVFALTLQIPPYGIAAVQRALGWIDLLGRGVDRIAVSYIQVRGRVRDLEADRLLVEALRRDFHEVDVATEPRPPVCPWAYPGYSTLLPSAPMP